MTTPASRPSDRRPQAPQPKAPRGRRPASPPRPRRRAPRLGSAGVIMEAATILFLRNGYLGTSIDDIAALAHVSKQTVYTHFADKEQLFTELIRGNFGRADDFVQALGAGLQHTQDQDMAA